MSQDGSWNIVGAETERSRQLTEKKALAKGVSIILMVVSDAHQQEQPMCIVNVRYEFSCVNILKSSHQIFLPLYSRI